MEVSTFPVQIEPYFSQQVSAWFNCAFDDLENDSRGVAFIVRENLSRICFCLYEKFESRLNVQAALSDHSHPKNAEFSAQEFCG